jgi:hypothetical protein
MKTKLLLLAACAACSLAAPSRAATLDITLGSTLQYGSGLSLAPNIDLKTFSGLQLGSDSHVITPPVLFPHTFTVPSGPLFDNNFLVLNGGSSNTKISLAHGNDLFGFTWGSIDTDNIVVLTDSKHHTFTITGADILNHVAGLSGDDAADRQENVVFKDPFASIVSAVFETACDPFEMGNFGQGEAPVPASLAMFGAALLGFGLLGNKRRKNRVAI